MRNPCGTTANPAAARPTWTTAFRPTLVRPRRRGRRPPTSGAGGTGAATRRHHRAPPFARPRHLAEPLATGVTSRVRRRRVPPSDAPASRPTRRKRSSRTASHPEGRHARAIRGSADRQPERTQHRPTVEQSATASCWRSVGSPGGGGQQVGQGCSCVMVPRSDGSERRLCRWPGYPEVTRRRRAPGGSCECASIVGDPVRVSPARRSPGQVRRTQPGDSARDTGGDDRQTLAMDRHLLGRRPRLAVVAQRLPASSSAADVGAPATVPTSVARDIDDGVHEQAPAHASGATRPSPHRARSTPASRARSAPRPRDRLRGRDTGGVQSRPVPPERLEHGVESPVGRGGCARGWRDRLRRFAEQRNGHGAVTCLDVGAAVKMPRGDDGC